MILPGDGIGPEVIGAASRVLADVADLELDERSLGGASADEHDIAVTEEVLEACRGYDAILAGPVGDPGSGGAVTSSLRHGEAHAQLRGALDLFVGLTPIRHQPPLVRSAPLRRKRIARTDLLIVCELSGGLVGGKRSRDVDRAFDTYRYRTIEIERAARLAFSAAERRSGRLTSVDRADTLEASRLWRDTLEAVAPEHPDVALEHLLAEQAAITLVEDPARFDVILVDRMIGDVICAQASAATGTRRILASGAIGAAPPGLFGPCHGPAAELAGKSVANPLPSFLAVALLLRHGLGLEAEAERVEVAVEAALGMGFRTPDLLSGSAGERRATTEIMTSAVLTELGGLHPPPASA